MKINWRAEIKEQNISARQIVANCGPSERCENKKWLPGFYGSNGLYITNTPFFHPKSIWKKQVSVGEIIVIRKWSIHFTRKDRFC